MKLKPGAIPFYKNVESSQNGTMQRDSDSRSSSESIEFFIDIADAVDEVPPEDCPEEKPGIAIIRTIHTSPQPVAATKQMINAVTTDGRGGPTGSHKSENPASSVELIPVAEPSQGEAVNGCLTMDSSSARVVNSGKYACSVECCPAAGGTNA